jgi:hypothetical protein
MIDPAAWPASIFGTWTRHTVLIGALEQEFTVNMEITVFPRFNRHAWVDPLVVVL